MKPHLKLAETVTPDGGRLSLHAHDGSFCIRCNGQELMHSSAAASELLLGELAVARVRRAAPARVLIGGLGLGFTLKSVLAGLGAHARVHVAELLPAVVSWNRGFLAGLNGALLEDPRVDVFTGDVNACLQRAPRGTYDAVVLDIDNGPAALVQTRNARTYDLRGLQRVAAALKPAGRVAIWSAAADPKFAARLGQAGFSVETVAAKVHAGARRAAYTIYLADRRAGEASAS